MEDRVYKLATEQQWNAALAQGSFTGAPVDIEDGFIHFSTSAQVQMTALKHFSGVENLLLLTISVAVLENLGRKLTWEPSRGGDLFPHLYDSLPLGAVTEVVGLPLDEDKHHKFPQLPNN